MDEKIRGKDSKRWQSEMFSLVFASGTEHILYRRRLEGPVQVVLEGEVARQPLDNVNELVLVLLPRNATCAALNGCRDSHAELATHLLRETVQHLQHEF